MKVLLKQLIEETYNLGSDKSTIGKWRLFVLSILKSRIPIAERKSKDWKKLHDYDPKQLVGVENVKTDTIGRIKALSYVHKVRSQIRGRVMIEALENELKLKEAYKHQPNSGWMMEMWRTFGRPMTSRMPLKLLYTILNMLEYMNTVITERIRRNKENPPRKPHRMPHERNMKVSEFWLHRIPHWVRGQEKKVKILRCNRYLAMQEKRLRKLVEEKKYDAAVRLWMGLIQRSYSYQVAVFNKLVGGWYWRFKEEYAWKTLGKLVKKCRKFDLTMSITRKYIMKANGKMRPIGHPDIPSRAMSKMVNDMIYWVTEPNRNKMQHGYRKKRGVHSALLLCVTYFKMGYNCYEFDLQSFFNTVPREEIKLKLSKLAGPTLAQLVDKIIIEIQYRNIDDLLDEKELKLYGKKLHGGKEIPLIVRSGIPQGLPLSPVVSTLVLESYNPPKDLVMYADDGLMFYKSSEKTETMKEFTNWTKNLARRGIKIAEEKSGEIKPFVKDGKRYYCFKFLGVWIDLENQLLMFREKTKSLVYPEGKPHYISWDNPKLEEWLKKAAQWYGSQNDKWKWNIDEKAMINRDEFITSERLNYTEKVITWWTGYLFESNPWRGWRYFPGIYNVKAVAEEFLKKEYKNLEREGTRAVEWSKSWKMMIKSGTKVGWPFAWNDYEHNKVELLTKKKKTKLGSLEIKWRSNWKDGRYYDIAGSSTIGCEILLGERKSYDTCKKQDIKDMDRVPRPVKALEINRSLPVTPMRELIQFGRNVILEGNQMKDTFYWGDKGSSVTVDSKPNDGLRNHRKGYYELLNIGRIVGVIPWYRKLDRVKQRLEKLKEKHRLKKWKKNYGNNPRKSEACKSKGV